LPEAAKAEAGEVFVCRRTVRIKSPVPELYRQVEEVNEDKSS
jgi:hypothetical protein